MPVIELRRWIAFTAFLDNRQGRKKGRTWIRSALPYCRLPGARVARQRCPILQPSSHSLAYLSPFKIGHLYFAIFRTFLLCIDNFLLFQLSICTSENIDDKRILLYK